MVELGAGRGYWAAQLAGTGIRVEAYESAPPDRARNPSFLPATGQTDLWHSVGDLNDLETRGAIGPDDVLFLCWPPGWGNPMASQALTTFTASGGERMVYIGEPKGGKTGNDTFFDTLTANWKLKSEDTQFVSWWNLTDRAQGWVRH